MKRIRLLPENGKRIFDTERRILNRLDKSVFSIGFFCVSIVAFAIRYALIDNISGDANGCLLPWYETIMENGGLAALKQQTGNYTILYQFLIALFTYIPVRPLYVYKALSCLFDYLLAGLLGKMAYDHAENDKELWGLAAYSAVLLSPIVFLNSGYWAQCDSIYVFFCVAALARLTKGKYTSAFILLGVGFSFKLQAVFMLPFFLFAYYRERKFSLLYFLLIPAMMIVTSLPGLLAGRSLLDVFTVYGGQVTGYSKMSLNWPSFWLILYTTDMKRMYELLQYPAICLAVCALAALMLYWRYKKIPLTKQNAVRMAFLLAYTCVLLLPKMHERYGYLYEILALLIFCYDRKTVLLMVPLYTITLMTYGYYIFRMDINMTVLGVANTAVFVLYACYLTKQMRRRMPDMPTEQAA